MRRTSYSTLCWQIRHTSLITFCLYDIQNTTLYYVGLIILTLWWSSGFRPWGVPGVLPGLQSPSRYIIVVSLFVGSHLTTHCHSGLVSPAAWDCETVRVQDPSSIMQDRPVSQRWIQYTTGQSVYNEIHLSYITQMTRTTKFVVVRIFGARESVLLPFDC